MKTLVDVPDAKLTGNSKRPESSLLSLPVFSRFLPRVVCARAFVEAKRREGRKGVR